MNNENSTRVVVADIRMPFWSMVRFMVKWAIAAIPALIILALIGTALSALATALLAHSMGRMVDATPAHAIVATAEV
jgi:hypothetical protein